jgi:hypothetical protein
MFEDIIGGKKKSKDDIAHVITPGDGITLCAHCGSDNISKGSPVYLITGTYKYRTLCECKSCGGTWSLLTDPKTGYKIELHLKK